MISRCLLLAGLLASAAAAPAQTRYTWAGGSGDWDVEANWVPAGVPAATDTAVVAPTFEGAVTLTAATTVAALELADFGAVGGDFDLTITDRFLWIGGGTSFDAFLGEGLVTIAPGATMRMAEPSFGFSIGPGRTIVNEGLLVWETTARWEAQGRLVNAGEMDLAMGPTDAFGFFFSSLTDALTNTADGVIRRTGPGPARLQAGFVNDGLVRVEQGAFDLKGFNATGTTGSGEIVIEPGTELLVTGGNHTLPRVTGEAVSIFDPAALTVTQTYDVATTTLPATGGALDAQLFIDGAGTTGALVVEGGNATLGGSGTLTVTGSFVWNDGAMTGSGTTVIAPAVPLDVGAFDLSLFETRTLRIEGDPTWTGDDVFAIFGQDGNTIEIAGTLTSTGTGSRRFTSGAGAALRITGALVHTDGEVEFESPVHNEGEVRIEGGTFRYQNTSGGTDTGRYVVEAGAELVVADVGRALAETAEVVGTGTVAAVFPFANAATWRPGASPGVLAVSTDHDFGDGVLEVELGGHAPGTEFDQLAVSGAATLGGTLRVVLTDGFEPAEGDRFLIVPAASVEGTFDALDLPGGLEATVETTPEGAELVIGAVTVLVTWARRHPPGR
ncbi:MAG: hypothetical protein R3362_07950 [Rhodothermales bacterium]|nr:hypothetical protein [Rhodothermales bacterium]